MADYDYSPLEPSQIRLIKIDINDGDETHASIEQADLDPEDPITYSTLSYVWGDASQIIQLPCDGKVTNITTTLHEALWQVAKFNPHKLLWRSEQYPDDWEGLEKYEEISAEESTNLGISFDDEESWDAFADFFDRPWFQHIWIVQEILPARKAIMICGSHSLEWKVLQAAARWYHYKAAAVASRHQRDVNIVDLTIAMNWPLRRLLEQFRPRLETEAKDKVYALLGVSDMGELREMFDSVTKAMISKDGIYEDDLDIVMTARRHNDEPRRPTWVPDWRMENGSGCKCGVGQPLPTNETIQHSHLTPMLIENGLAEFHDACVSTFFSYPTGEDLEVAFALTVMAGELPNDITKSGMSLEAYTNNYLDCVRVLVLPLDTEEQRQARLKEAQPLLRLGFRNDWAQKFLTAYYKRRFYMTDTQYMGLGNHNMMEGNLIVVLQGSVSTPRVEKMTTNKCVHSEAYCHGMMGGEALNDLERMEGRVVSGSQRFILH
ncbi:hypothetical protein EDB81DRAFT_843180 [Dactylonectria macrodidyma]|uniref:Heterokaryon incompatibility domain-containing protein n=1 Tax=Dactylonectria macrodidyma TaxID=307937 RepID=A0A9P9ETD2_9HYPO|nr:hypothetical protein EDB81DRAFT_843180 [Dactylonectria macrodidyma]